MEGGDQIITSFQLDISLYDDPSDKWSTRETATILAPVSGGEYNFSLEFTSFETSIDGWIDLMDDGTLNVLILATRGDFYADWSNLTVVSESCTPSAEPVPEPATMILLGTGLVGIAGATRKKIFKKS